MNSPTAKSTSPPATDQPVIYAVDDEVMILELIAVVLEPQGYRVRTFTDPARAYEALLAATPPPAVIITDYAMHTMNGMELIEKCRAFAPNQKIILASGTVGEDIYANSPAKPDHFLAKPFKTGNLVAVVKELAVRTGG